MATPNASTPNPMPMLACTPRVKSSTPWSWPPACASSNATARSITGSTNARAKTNAATLAIAPASRPRAIIRFSIVRVLRCGSVAGEAEQVPGVVGELVHRGVAAEHRRRSLIQADEVEHEQGEESRRRQPHHGLGGRDVQG